MEKMLVEQAPGKPSWVSLGKLNVTAWFKPSLRVSQA